MTVTTRIILSSGIDIRIDFISCDHTACDIVNYSTFLHSMTRRQILITFFLLLLALAGFMFSQTKRRSLCRDFHCIRMDKLDVFRLKDLYSDTPDAYRVLFQSGNQWLRIEAKPVPLATSGQELNAAVTKVKAMFEKAPAPYPGDVSDAVVCDSRFVPTYEEIQTETNPLSLFVGYLNDRMTFGSCSENQAVYRGILALTYCPKQTLLLRIELIAKVSDFLSHEKELVDQIKSLRCAP